MKLLHEFLIDSIVRYYFKFNKPYYFISFICLFSFISCAPGFFPMKESIDEFNKKPNNYISLEELLKSETPIILNENEEVTGELNKDDKVLFIKGKIKKTYYDIYQINNQVKSEIKFHSKALPWYGRMNWSIVPKLFLYSRNNINEYLCTSESFVKDLRVYSEMTCKLEENTIYYLLVCADPSHLLESISTEPGYYMTYNNRGARYSFPLVSITNEGSYDLKIIKNK